MRSHVCVVLCCVVPSYDDVLSYPLIIVLSYFHVMFDHKMCVALKISHGIIVRVYILIV